MSEDIFIDNLCDFQEEKRQQEERIRKEEKRKKKKKKEGRKKEFRRHLMLARKARDERDIPMAELYCREARRLDPDNSDARILEGQLQQIRASCKYVLKEMENELSLQEKATAYGMLMDGFEGDPEVFAKNIVNNIRCERMDNLRRSARRALADDCVEEALYLAEQMLRTDPNDRAASMTLEHSRRRRSLELPNYSKPDTGLPYLPPWELYR